MSSDYKLFVIIIVIESNSDRRCGEKIGKT